MKLKIRFWRKAIFLFFVGALFLPFQNFTSTYILAPGRSYVFDNFETGTRTRTIWNMSGASCNQVLHKDSNGRYSTFGQTGRPGYCDISYDPQSPNNKFLRFITYPFDRRDAGKVSFEYSVDQGKGGSETRARTSYLFNSVASGKALYEGWDFGGDYYATPTNTLRYTFDFRVTDLSILEEKLAASATIAQFHQGAKMLQKSCGTYYAGSAPSPGLYVKLNDTNSSLVDFRLSLKLFEEEIPSSLRPFKTSCVTQSPISGTVGPARSICEVVAWTGSYPKKDVVQKWFSVSFIMKNSKAGALEFFFGSKESSTDSIKYGRKIFLNKAGRLNVSTTFNDCPAQIYLGNYVLGYTQLDPTVTSSRSPLYGFYKADWLGLPASATLEEKQKACSIKPAGATRWLPDIHRLCQGDKWVSDRIYEKYGKFINGSYGSNETPPRFITDYDNFRIVQHQ